MAETKQVSIHVPAKGTTENVIDVVGDLSVSIHVPAKGTTKPFSSLASLQIGFNPRSREGNDAIPKSPYRSSAGFQSTFPRRERRLCGGDQGRF